MTRWNRHSTATKHTHCILILFHTDFLNILILWSYYVAVAILGKHEPACLPVPGRRSLLRFLALRGILIFLRPAGRVIFLLLFLAQLLVLLRLVLRIFFVFSGS